MITQDAREKFKQYPVIAAARTPEDFRCALESRVRVVFMVGGDVFKVKNEIKAIKASGRLIFFHMDLVAGIGKDGSGIRFAKEAFEIDGIQSTKTHMLKLAKQEKLMTSHRIFLMDYQALQSGLHMIKESQPDFIELTPGIVPRIVRKVSDDFDQPIISSGLVSRAADVKILQEAGAQNIVCSARDLWFL
ncbi:glycerol-3-phosphate responsive antiterminator [Eubacterium barkeri]|uniref:Glycerol uptake operon antiterminator n=1 Tax=Eubacterium barkeri TaxID=1528 RepID=A0A1H3JVV1_EUBBA|nr:glycerol-3-phosphate responsive antiterminator [Eubacterium barkeri]SDY43635.1 glycerol uptake operon antiterminator [Eubacterium barkeri]